MDPQENQKIIQKPRYISKLTKPIFKAQKETESQLKSLLLASSQHFHMSINLRLQNLRRKSQEKVYSALEGSPEVYFSVLLKQLLPNIERDQPYLNEFARKREKQVMSQLKNKNISIEKNNKSCSEIKQQLEQKLQIIRKKSPLTHINEFQLEAEKRRQQEKQANKIEFRSKGYWKSNEKNKMAQNFIRDIQRQQLQQKRKMNALNKQKQKRQRQIQEKKQKKLLQQIQKQKDSLFEKYKQAKLKKQKQIKDEANKQKKASQFLQKFRDHIPAHINFQEKFEKIEQNQKQVRQKLLKSHRQAKRHESLNEIFKSMEKYQQQKQIQAQQKKQRRYLQEQQCENIRLRLNKLYKSRTRSYSAAKQMPEEADKKEKQQKMMKMMMYSQIVKQKYPPNIDPKLKEELKSSIEQQTKLINKIQKKKEGSIILVDKNDFNSREIGLKYLQQIKQYLKNAPRKPSLNPQTEQIKIVDKSLIKNKVYSHKECFFNARKWNGIIQDKNLTLQQKNSMLQNYFSLIEDQKQKQASLLKQSSFQKQIEAFKRMDQLQLQKAAAKLKLLKQF